THSRIADLETRAVAAIEAGRDDLATETAETIAALEAERDASQTARALFAAEIAKLKGHVLQQQMRFSQLERGRRIARAAEAVRVARRGRIETPAIFEGTLAEAEATLSRLRERQVEADAAEAAFDALDAATGPIVVAEKLSAEGFGPRLKPNAADVLARLRQRAAAARRQLISSRPHQTEYDHESTSPSPQSVLDSLYLCLFFVAALAMVVGGIALMPIDLAM